MFFGFKMSIHAKIAEEEKEPATTEWAEHPLLYVHFKANIKYHREGE